MTPIGYWAILTKPQRCICSHGINSEVTSMNKLDRMPSSDHLPLQAEINVDINCAFNLIDDNACPRDIVSYKWSQYTPDDLHQYCCSTYALFSDIYVTPGVKCNNPDCNLASHKSDIDCIVLYCIVLYCIVLYCIIRPHTEGRLDRYRIGIPRELSKIGTQPWLSDR